MKNIVRYFIQGLLIIVPVAITGFIILRIISWFDSIFEGVGIAINPYIDSWIAIVAVIVIIFLVGFIGSSFFFKPLFNLFDHALGKAPFIKTVYSSTKDLLSAFVGSKKKFNKPVLVTINKENNIEQLGFITNSELSYLKMRGKVAVYVPMSYSFSGNLLIVPSANIQPIEMSPSETMKFIISGGVSDID